MRTRSLLLWPFRVIGALVRLVVWPVLLDAVCFFVLPHGWFVLVVVMSGVYTAVVLRIWLRVVRGMLSSMARGTVTVRGYSDRRGRGRRRR